MTHPMPLRRLGHEVVLALIAVVAIGAASVLGQLATYPTLVAWYANLENPWFTLPSWVFGPVWTGLYALMAFALWRVLRAPGHFAGRRFAVVLFGLMPRGPGCSLGPTRDDQHHPAAAHHSGHHCSIHPCR
jgi:hypothetical protein